MRSPGAAFDLRAALTQELSAAIEAIDAPVPLPIAVHRCRVRLKRARALARVGEAGAPGLSAVFNDSARAVMQSLAQRRDLTAFAESARAAAKHAAKKDAQSLITIAEALEAECAALPRLDVERVRAGIGDLLALAQVWPEPSARQIRKGAKRLARRAKAAFKDARGERRAKPRHQWRKREKDRVFAATLLNDAWPTKRRRRGGERLGDLLGKEWDAVLLCERLVESPTLAGSEKAAKRARRLLKQRIRRQRRRADALGRAVHAGGA